MLTGTNEKDNVYILPSAIRSFHKDCVFVHVFVKYKRVHSVMMCLLSFDKPVEICFK